MFTNGEMEEVVNLVMESLETNLSTQRKMLSLMLWKITVYQSLKLELPMKEQWLYWVTERFTDGAEISEDNWVFENKITLEQIGKYMFHSLSTWFMQIKERR